MTEKQSLHNWQFLSIIGFMLMTVLVHYLPMVDLSVESLSKGIYSEASFEGLDVKARKNLFWKLLFFSGIVTYALHLIWSKLKNNVHLEFFFDGIAFLSFIGICIYWMQLIGIEVGHCQNLLYSSFLVLPIYAFAIHRERNDFQENHFERFILMAMALSFIFILLLPKGDYLSENFIYASILLLGLYFLSKSDKVGGYVVGLLPIVFLIPLYYFLGLEILVNIQSNAGHRGSFIIGAFLLIFTACIFYAIYKEKSTFVKLLCGVSIVLAFSILGYYEYAIDYPSDEFEIANRANAMMRFFHFHELPFVDYLSSHNLFDHLWPFLYTSVNGYTDNVSFLSYGFARHAVTAIGGFVLMSYLFRSWSLAALFVIVFPFNRALFPMAMALLMPIFLSRSYQDFSNRKLMWIPIWTIFLILWKMDVGFGNLIAVCASLGIYFFHFGSADKFKKLAKAAMVPFVVLLIAFVLLGLIYGFSSLFKSISQALGYFSADQAHGLSSLTNGEYNRVFLVHYFGFPILVFGIFVYLLINFKKIFAERQKLLIALVYLCVFYFANFQRGLVRHSFMSGSDAFLSSYVYLIFALFASLFVLQKYRWVIFILVSMFFIHNFRFAEARGLHSIYQRSADFVRSLPAYQIKNTNYTEDRMTNSNKPYAAFKKLMDEQCDEDDSFIEFTSTPMMYFYTQRNVPSYFNQYLQNTVTAKLQLQNIEDLSLSELPFVVYKSENRGWGDATDNVPNALRYLELNHLIFENYRPYRNIDKKEIWIHNDYRIKPKKETGVTKVYRDSLENYDLSLLPNFRNESIVEINRVTLNLVDGVFRPKANPDSWKHNYLLIELNQASNAKNIKLEFSFPLTTSNQFNTTTIEFEARDSKIFEIPLSWIHHYYLNRNEQTKLIVKVIPDLSIKEMSIIEAKFDQ